jgi:O-antigen/teichoic acid export membrane protein
MLVARGLGPEQYGTMMFLIGTFAAIGQLLDMGSATAFFTFLSQRPRSRSFVGWYFVWLGVEFLLPLLAVGLLLPTSWIELIWNGEQRLLVILAFIAVYFQSTIWTVVLRMGEAQRLTRRVQGVAVAVAFAHLMLVAFAWWGDWLAIRSVFLLMIIEWVIAIAVTVKQLSFQEMAGKKDTFKTIIAEFWLYCLPLIPYTWMGCAYAFTDRWLLQNYAGSVEQAYYSVAYQLGAIATIATSSILNIFWKEIAEAHEQKNTERVVMLYRRVTRGLFCFAAAVAGFLIPWASEILRLLLGPAYVGGVTALTIMLLYPLHQCMGQIGGTMLYATGQVRAQVVGGMIFMSSSIVVSYFLLTPSDASIPGFGLSSTGLAGKMVIMQFLQVNAVAYYLSRKLKIEFEWVYQPAIALSFLGTGFLAYAVRMESLNIGNLIWLSMLATGALYAIIVLALVIIFPSLLGMNRSDLNFSLIAARKVMGLK